jgi:hypothetical protein
MPAAGDIELCEKVCMGLYATMVKFQKNKLAVTSKFTVDLDKTGFPGFSNPYQEFSITWFS